MKEGISRRQFISTSAIGAASLFIPRISAFTQTDALLLTSANHNEIWNVISSFLCDYYSSFSFDGSSDIVERYFGENDNTRMVKAMNEWYRTSLLMLGYTYEDIEITITPESLEITDGKSAIVDASVLVSFRYSDNNARNKRTRIRLDYDFVLSQTGQQKWQIDYVYSDSDSYKRFKNAYENAKAEKITTGEIRDSASIAKDRLLQEDDNWFRALASETTLSARESEVIREETKASREREQSRASVSYVYAKAIYYSDWYATAHKSNWLFYDAGADCTNFTSQCFWAGYGGAYPDASGMYPDIAVMSSYISNRKFMNYVYDPNSVLGWYGGTGGGCYQWENVDAFWNNASATSQPNGSPMIPGTKASMLGSGHILWLFDGDLVQFRWSSISGSLYNHSMLVEFNSMSGTTTGVYLSGHSPQQAFYKMSNKILDNGGSSNVYVRSMVMGTSNLTI